ncbi:MAG: TetR/AcrR family transcriptional regulator [Alphaproteobacteria bacterium]|nr:TetR/AcrR family transcriptional regulator [Alphaproteobacteria bacterium]
MATATVPRRRRTQHERRAETIRKLIAATIACLNECGYAGTTTTLVARRAGVTRGALQHHFQSKDDLLVATHVHVSHLLHARLARMIDRRGPLRQRCGQVVTLLWEVFGSPEYTAALELTLGTRNERELHRAITRIRTLSMRREDRMWLELFADARAPRARVRDSRYFLWECLAGLSIQAMFRRRPGFVDDCLRMAAEALQSLLEGAAGRR